MATAMEQLVPESKLHAELEFVRKHADVIATLKRLIPLNLVPADEDLPRRAPVVEVPVCAIPTHADDAEGATASTSEAQDTVELTVKSSKPPLSFALAARRTATISALKEEIASRVGAPAADAQRWILKGKAMADSKLLREYDVQDTAVINLMVKAGAPLRTEAAPSGGAPPAAAVASSEQAAAGSPAPAVTVSTERASGDFTAKTPASAPDAGGDRPVDASVAPGSERTHAVLAEPSLWADIHEVLQKHSTEAAVTREILESWLGSSMPFLTPSDKARVREALGLSALAGI